MGVGVTVVMMVFMIALMTVIVAMSVSVVVLVLVFIATAMVALAQLVDVVGAHARLGHFINDVAPGMVVVRASSHEPDWQRSPARYGESPRARGRYGAGREWQRPR